MKKFLVIQTAFTGDAILSTAILEKLHQSLPDASIDYLVRKGNEGLFAGHPFIRNLLIWNKREGKYRELWRILKIIRKERYDEVINVQRFATTGFLTAFSGAKVKTGFDKNPFSLLFTNKIQHRLKNGWHETDRNQQLIRRLTGNEKAMPHLYPTSDDHEKVKELTSTPFITIAPGSVWFTKTFPEYKWIDLIAKKLSEVPELKIYLLGSPEEREKCERISAHAKSNRVIVLAGKLSLLQSAALMQKAKMNYCNDSAPMHLCSAMDAPVTAIYCSTVPEFGFGPLSSVSRIVQTSEKLDCKPCGLHGYRQCPLIHFKCAHTININEL